MKRTTIVPISKKRKAALPERKAVREAVLERDGYECQFWAHAREQLSGITDPDIPLACGGQLEVHEVIPRSAWAAGWLVPANCKTLCSRHHQWVTEHPTLAHEIGLHGFSHERPSPGESM